MTPREALDWVLDKGQEFGRAGPRILDGMHRAAVYAGSLPAGSAERATARRVVERWGALLRAHQSTLNTWDALAEKIPGVEGLGAIIVIPIALGASIVAVALAMALILRRLTAEERALRLLERGDITAAQAIELAAELEGGPSLLGSPKVFGLPLWVPVALGVGYWALERQAGR